MLILCALIGGKLITGLCWLLYRFCKVDIRLPPLLGMLLVGIVLKNVPYNFGQFGRAECNALHENVSFVDSIWEYDKLEDHESFKKRSAGIQYILTFLNVLKVAEKCIFINNRTFFLRRGRS